MKRAQPKIGGGLVEVLLREGLITRAHIEEALTIQRSTDKPLARILVEMGAITESAKMSVLKKVFGYDMAALVTEKLDPKILSLIPRSIAFRHYIVPVGIEGDSLILAMEDPSNLVLIDNLKALVGMAIRPVIASSADIDEALKHYPAEEVVYKLREPFLYRVLSATFLPVVGLLAPLIITLLVLGRYAVKLAKWQAFDFVLYFILGFGIWALITWEIEGLLFRTKHK